MRLSLNLPIVTSLVKVCRPHMLPFPPQISHLQDLHVFLHKYVFRLLQWAILVQDIAQHHSVFGKVSEKVSRLVFRLYSANCVRCLSQWDLTF